MTGVNLEFVSLLRCPITGEQLHVATTEELRHFHGNEADGFLVREDGTVAYPVRDGIPSLLPDSCIPIDQTC
jgi:uncharacterized protein YbaR (Trm112 family)